MNRIYKPYWTWEEYLNGMYNGYEKRELEHMINLSTDFMFNVDLFYFHMRISVFEWSNTMLHNLTNTSKNRIAFIGQCACSHALKVNDIAVKTAWKSLPINIKNEANIKAKNVLLDWILEYEKKNN